VEREGRKYWAYSEDFPGVYGLGNSIEEAKTSILEAMRLYIEEWGTELVDSLLNFKPFLR
jgi:predicted RNase H-like HicB family nuclease